MRFGFDKFDRSFVYSFKEIKTDGSELYDTTGRPEQEKVINQLLKISGAR